MSVPRALSCERSMLPAGMDPAFGLQTPERPSSVQFGPESTDDPAIFVFDTMDRAKANMLTTSPSAVALLTPQRVPAVPCPALDFADYDVDGIGCGANRHRSTPRKSYGRKSQERTVLVDVTHKANTSGNTSWKTPVAKRLSSSLQRAASGTGHTGCSPSPRCAPLHSRADDTFLISVEEVEKMRRDRRRFEKMYEHQKNLYEELRDRFGEVYRQFQQKIVEVIALSTRLEYSKSIIRQQKKDSFEARSTTVSRENKILKELKKEDRSRAVAEREKLEYREKYERLLVEHKTKMAALESLQGDLTCMIEDSDRIHVSQLDGLLRASYSKTTSLINELMRQRKSYQALSEEKLAADRRLEAAVKERRASEARFVAELDRRERECERLYEQSQEQQQSILHLRQLLIRTMDRAEEYSSEEELEGEEEEEYDVDHSRSYSHPRSSDDVAEVSAIEREPPTRFPPPQSPCKENSCAGLEQSLRGCAGAKSSAQRTPCISVLHYPPANEDEPEPVNSGRRSSGGVREDTPLMGGDDHSRVTGATTCQRHSEGRPPTAAPIKLFGCSPLLGRSNHFSVGLDGSTGGLFREPQLSTSLAEAELHHQREMNDSPPSSILLPRRELYSLGNSPPPVIPSPFLNSPKVSALPRTIPQ